MNMAGKVQGKQGFATNLIGSFVQPKAEVVEGIRFRAYPGGWPKSNPAYAEIVGTYLKDGEPRLLIKTPDGELDDTFPKAVEVVKSPEGTKTPQWDDLTNEQREKIYAAKHGKRVQS